MSLNAYQTLNEYIYKVLVSRGEVSSDEVFVNTERFGFMHFGQGDQIVFRSNDKELGVHNGMRGVLIEAKKDRFVVEVDCLPGTSACHPELDSGSRKDHESAQGPGSARNALDRDDTLVAFDPTKYNDIQHGYAGTIHSSQGLTFDHVYALHSKHINQNLFYVANSRHRLGMHYFSYGNKDQVYKDVDRKDEKMLTNASQGEEDRGWIYEVVDYLSDRFSKNHAFYKMDTYYKRAGRFDY